MQGIEKKVASNFEMMFRRDVNNHYFYIILSRRILQNRMNRFDLSF